MKAGGMMREGITELQMMDHLPNMIWRDDLNRQWVYLNKKWLDFTGMNRDEALGSGWMKALHPEEVFDFNETYTHSFENQKPFEMVHRLRRFDGEYRKVMNSANPYYDQSGHFAGFVGSLYDITKHKDFELALENINNFYVKIFDNFPVTIWGADQRGQLTFVSQNAVEFLGESEDDILNGEWKRFLHPEDRVKYSESYKASLSGGTTVEMEVRFRNQAGEYQWFQIMNKAMYNDEGKLDGYIGIGFNIHDKKLTEDKLKIYKLLSENAQEMILFIDLDGKIIEANERAVAVYGYCREELLGLDIREIRRDWTMSPEQIRQANTSGVFFETVHYKKDGSPLSVEITAQGAYIAGKNVLMSVIRDIEHKKKSDMELRRAKEEAENANRIKSEFLANMSHEIRTPINGILGMIDLTMLTPLDENQRENMVTAKNCAASLLQVINDILDFSKLEAGKLILHNIDFDLEKLIFQITKSHYVSASEKGLRLIYTLSPHIPRFLMGDPNRLQQILNNLINNAVKFTDYGEIKIDVKGHTDRKGKVDIEFLVADTGIGISQENIQKLFKSFSQIDGSYTRQFGGTGLGLVISRQLAEMMGGSLWVESKEGKGSTFHFKVTLDAGSRPESRAALLPNKNRSFKRYQVLVVEDDAVNQLFLSRILEKEGHFVENASNGWQALAFCENKQYDVILMDIQMPEMDGIEASKRIRQMKNNKNTPIIALTAYALQGDRERFLEQGLDEYVPKPVNMEELLQAMEKVTSGNELRIEIQKDPFIIKDGELVFDADREKISEEDRLAYEDQINQNLKKLIQFGILMTKIMTELMI